ncbi:MAG TPA: QsdR family transcriptional regulator [Aldersonia sp.]
MLQKYNAQPKGPGVQSSAPHVIQQHREVCAISDTKLSRLLAETDHKPDALTAFRLARQWFKENRRIEMRELAEELGVSRATLFRWVGSRDDLLAEVLWSLAQPTLEQAQQSVRGRGGVRVARVLRRYAELMHTADYFRAYLHREPERALRVLTTAAGTVQGRVVAAVGEILRDEVEHGALTLSLPLRDMAYLLVRIVETFLYTDIITGDEPDPAKIEQATAALLRD